MEFKNKLLNYIFGSLGFFIFFMSAISFIRIDAEFLIFLSVVFVLMTVWNSLSTMLSKYLFVKSTIYYYFFLRYYQARLWLIYSVYTFVKLYLFVRKLPYFSHWYNFYSNNVSTIILKEISQISSRWDNFLNYFIYKLILGLMVILWTSFYRYSFNLFNLTTEGVSYRQDWRKLTEYALMNKLNFI